MKVIAIFCDGTWNSRTIEETTHVVELNDACLKDAQQVPAYFEGVGAGTRFSTFIGKTLDKLGGGAFGWGLSNNVKMAYLEVCRLYEPNAKIMIFGFSRGAYTARSIAGMIRKCGLLPKTSLSKRAANRAFRLYKKKSDDDHPDAPHIMRERKLISPDYVTSPKEQAARDDGSELISIAYLGIWDTVGAKGLPASMLGPIAKWWNRRYEFYDNVLSSSVKSARHAVATDERRDAFEPSLWLNLDGEKGLNKGQVGPDRPFQQLWFAGNHSVVGGSNAKNKPISALTLEWVIEGAVAAGLRLRQDVECPDTRPNSMFVGHKLDEASGAGSSIVSPRKGLNSVDACHASLINRLENMDDYRPAAARPARPDLF